MTVALVGLALAAGWPALAGPAAGRSPGLRDMRGLGAETLVDASGTLTAAQLLIPPWSERFQAAGGPVSFGLGSPPVWVRFGLENGSTVERAESVAWEAPLVEQLELCLAREGAPLQCWRGGLAVPVAERTIAFQGSAHVATVLLPPGSRATVLLRAQARGPLFATVSAWEGTGPSPRRPPALILYGVGIGVVLVLAGMALVQYGSWRDPSYLWYALFVLAYGTYGATVTGFAPLALWPDHPGFALAAQPLFSGLSGLFGTVFVRAYLDTASRRPRMDRVLVGLAAANLAAGLLGFLSLGLANALTAAAATATLAAAISEGLAARASRPERAHWFLVGFLTFAGFGALFALAVLGAVRPYPGLLWGMQGGFVLTGLALALALAERRAQEGEERFRLAFDTSPDAIALNRLADGVYVAVNESFTRIAGWTPAEVVGRSSLELSIWADPRDRERLVEELRRTGTARNLEFAFRLKNGRIGTGLMSARIIHLHGEPLILSITRDITEIRAADAERARLQEELRQSQKMEAIGRLAGGIAHDFNNVLTAISTNVGLGLADARPEDPMRPLLEEIQEAVQRATGLTRQLLAFSRRQRVSRRWISLGGLVEGMRKLLARLIGEDVRLELAPSPTPLLIVADHGLVEQVVMNLVVNARDAVGPGGRIAVETRLAEVREAGPERPAGRYAVLTVRDDGQGMAAETLRHIFEPFFTTKAGERGTGIGLATVYGIVRQHGGFIDVRSEPGAGSTFEVFWPMAEGAPAALAARPEDGRLPLPVGTETLLLVEDEAKVRQPTGALLRRLGYRVLAAVDGAEALAMAGAHSGPIDLVVTDVVMPNMDGAEMVGRLTVARPGTRVLFMSGYDDRILARRGFGDAAVEFLPKPFTVEELAGHIRAILDAARPRGS